MMLSLTAKYLPTFKSFILEAFTKPYYKASKEFKIALNRLDAGKKRRAIEILTKFKADKTLSPGFFIKSFNDHKLSRKLSDYCEFHIDHGKVCIIYLHRGRSLLFIDIIPHDMLENDKFADALKSKFDKIAVETSAEVDKNLKAYDER